MKANCSNSGLVIANAIFLFKFTSFVKTMGLQCEELRSPISFLREQKLFQMDAAFVIKNFFNDNKANLMDLMMRTIKMDCQLACFLVINHG